MLVLMVKRTHTHRATIHSVAIAHTVVHHQTAATLPVQIVLAHQFQMTKIETLLMIVPKIETHRRMKTKKGTNHLTATKIRNEAIHATAMPHSDTSHRKI